MKERRKHPRTPLAVSLEMNNTHQKSIGKGFVTNLSEGGMALETPKALHQGARLAFRFHVPGGPAFEIPGEIVYVRDGVLNRAYGAKFGDVDEAAGRRLREFVADARKKA